MLFQNAQRLPDAALALIRREFVYSGSTRPIPGPEWWWPADRSWLVHTDYDAVVTDVYGPAQLGDLIVADHVLEALPLADSAAWQLSAEEANLSLPRRSRPNARVGVMRSPGGARLARSPRTEHRSEGRSAWTTWRDTARFDAGSERHTVVRLHSLSLTLWSGHSQMGYWQHEPGDAERPVPLGIGPVRETWLGCQTDPWSLSWPDLPGTP